MSANMTTIPQVREVGQRLSDTKKASMSDTTGNGERTSEEIDAQPVEAADHERTRAASSLDQSDNTDRHMHPVERPPPTVNGRDGNFSKLKPNHDRSRASSRAKVPKQAALHQHSVPGRCKMYRFSLYETAARFYVVGGDLTDDRFRVLKIDRTVGFGHLSLAEDGSVYTKKEINKLIATIDEGNKGSGGLKLRCTAWGILGFIRFTGPWYMLLITKRSQIAMIGGSYIYQIDGTELVPVNTHSTSRFKSDQHPEETRFLATLNNLDLSKSFYFSYSYDVTHTLQHNLIRARQQSQASEQETPTGGFNDMFVWNHYLLQPALQSLKNVYDWCLPVVHGFVDQATLSVYGRSVYIAVLARRSRYFAGARFLKRGANDLGYVANDVETEQIVSEMLTTSFHGPGPKPYANWKYTSFVQHRGSIPLFWTQDTTGVSPKPPIEINVMDPFYGAAALHFDNLFQRYGAPVYVLNLIKARERTPRESKLLEEFTNAISYLNQFLPNDKKILYKAWDMSRASKSRDQDVIETLEAIAEEVVRTTGFFQNGDGSTGKPLTQKGIARTNCIDCLDRTNAAQFVIGKRALGHQLHALGVINETSLEYDTDAVNLFTHMYHDHGDTIAVQYGGSHLVNTMETYRKINQWTSHSRDMVESFKRYYHNSFLDSQRQEAYNLFLGNYIFAQGQPMLWDLSTDYYLHHSDPRLWSEKARRSYINWFTPEYLEQPDVTTMTGSTEGVVKSTQFPSDEYWTEYYRPLAVSSFLKMFSFKMNSKYIPSSQTLEGTIDLSPFRVRSSGYQDSSGKKKSKKDVTNLEPYDDQSDRSSQKSGITIPEKRAHWTPLAPVDEKMRNDSQDSVMEQAPGLLPMTELSSDGFTAAAAAAADKPLSAHWTLDQFVDNSLNPSITRSEAEEYQRYVSHPLTLPLVTSTDEISPNTNLEFQQYLNSVSPDVVSGSLGEDCNEEDLADYADFLTVAENPLTVTEADAPKKRYKAYRQWLKGRSLFKQQRVDAVLEI